MEYKCECGKDLVEYSGEGESSNFDIETINHSFVCEDSDCGKRYNIEFRAIEGTSCNECSEGEMELDDDSTDGNVFADCINMPTICSCCEGTSSMEYHPINIIREDD